MAEQSPEWKKPSEVMKLRRRSSLGSVTCKVTSVSVGQLQQSSGGISSDRKSQKRKNPFASSQIIIRPANTTDYDGTRTSVSITDSIDCQPGQGQLNKILGFQRKWTDEELPAAINSYQPAAVEPPVDQRVSSLEIERSINKMTDDEGSYDTLPSGAPTFPLDWSLKTKVRYLSPSQFDWCTPLRGFDESRGLDNFVRDSPLRPHEELKSADDTTAKQQSFQRCTMYWIHPNVPWLQTFPRISRSLRQVSQVHALNLNDDVNRALYNDWCDSMNSVYLMVRHGVCPYFYVCCHNMTLLFRSAGIVREEIHAIITPTTRGLRSALNEEGVEFSLPLLQSSPSTESVPSQPLGDSPASNQSCAEGTEVEDADEEDENLTDDSAASIWLLDLGLDQKRYRSVDPSKVRDQRDIFRQIDYRPVSTVLVEGVANTQALFNYILNCNICFATTGSQAGLPPTILSPTAFRGATLQSLKVRQGSVSEQTVIAKTGYRQQMYTVEVTGPVLPHAVAGLSRLFASTTHGSFTASFAVHDPTTPLNCIKRPNASSDDNIASKQSQVVTSSSQIISSTRLDSDVCHLEELGKEGLRELVCNKGLYTWTCN